MLQDDFEGYTRQIVGGAITVNSIPHQISGLQLEGCSFDGTRLLENQRDSLSVTTIPPCTVAWVAKDSPPPYNLAECISLPLYYSSDRYKLVTCLEVPSGSTTNRKRWIQSGAALFLKN